MRFISLIAAIALAACSQQEQSMTVDAGMETAQPAADSIFFGGPIYTADEIPDLTMEESVNADDTVDMVAVRDGIIVFAGYIDEAPEYLFGEQTEMIDLDGAAMYPGFTDAHVHVMGLGSRERLLNLEGTDSIEDLQARVAEAAADLPDGSVLQGRGWIETHWPEGRFPNRQDLDAVAPDVAVFLTRADGHALVANSLALERAGINAGSVAPEGGDILRDDDGEPTGMLIDAAMGPVRALAGGFTGQDRADVYLEGAWSAARYGWTGAHDMSVPWADVAMIESLSEELPIRVYISANPDGLAPLVADGPVFSDNRRVIARAVKMYMDGALGSRGAALLEPYSDDPANSGLVLSREDETLSAMVLALENGIQLNIHAIGDRGNRMLLDWIEEAQNATPAGEDAAANGRWRDEHTQIVDPADIPRFAELGVIPSMQPSHAIGDLFFAPDRLGPDRLDGAYAWRALIDSGVVIAGGSDAPVERGDPRIEFYAAVARRGLDGTQTEDWRPDQAVTRAEALRMFTAWPAYASFREDEVGRIVEGLRADFTVFSDDIMTIPEEDILTVEPVMTVLDGEIVWRAE
ncbi:amidohydrolase [Hyphobacterium sp. HN65]|uniref:Amidohydrolase n=1 Tax=Hyphobacterium lacteum TaxID=3116575 RepID=A0ABU7LRU3_9PROT|nr:amidohydrolase [Hyphobacterium sp. HN65]MEE2526049.1 amidohydrolase [Hyphobacterium sp. HN65]